MAKNSELWPCGHPRTEANTRKCGVAGFRCKECRKEIDRKHRAKLAAIKLTAHRLAA